MFLVVNQFIRIKILVKEGWYSKENGRQGDPRIQFMSFELLEDTIVKNSKKLTFQININQIKDGLVEKIESNLNGFKGNKHLFFDIYDNDKKVKDYYFTSKNQKMLFGIDFGSKVAPFGHQIWHQNRIKNDQKK